MLWVDGRYKYFISDSADIDFRRQKYQILTSTIDPYAVRVFMLKITNANNLSPLYQKYHFWLFANTDYSRF